MEYKKDLQNGTMTIDRLMDLYITIHQRRVKHLKYQVRHFYGYLIFFI
ncbi:hypothetical protein [Lysinibacillus sp. NPDC047702]